MRFRDLFAFGFLFAAAACATERGAQEADPGAIEESTGDDQSGQPGESPTGRPEVAPSVTYAATAEENWKLAEDAFADEDYAVAQRYYSYIRNKYPYTSFAAPSSLWIGDCQFER